MVSALMCGINLPKAMWDASLICPACRHGVHVCCIPPSAVAVRFAQDKYRFSEDDVRGIVVLTANGDTSKPFTVEVHSRDGTATGGSCTVRSCIRGV